MIVGSQKQVDELLDQRERDIEKKQKIRLKSGRKYQWHQIMEPTRSSAIENCLSRIKQQEREHLPRERSTMVE